MLQLPAITDIRDLGVFIAGIGAAVAGITWAVKTFRNGQPKNGGDSALNAEKRTNAARDLILGEIRLNSRQLAEMVKEIIGQQEEHFRERQREFIEFIRQELLARKRR